MDIPEAPTAEQNVAFLHENGELQEARDAESAAKLCPFLGKMSLEEVGLLLELQTIGHAVMDVKSTSEPEHKLQDESKSESLFSQVFEATESANKGTPSGLERRQTEQVITIPPEITRHYPIDTDVLMEPRHAVGETGVTQSSEVTNNDTLQTITAEASPLIAITREAPAAVLMEAPEEALTAVVAGQNFESQHNEEIRPPLNIVTSNKPIANRPPHSFPIARSQAKSINIAPPVFLAEKHVETEITTAVDTEQQTALAVNLVPIALETPVNEHRAEADVNALLPESHEVIESVYFLHDEEPETRVVIPDLLHKIESSDTDTKQRANDIIREIIAAPANLEAPGEAVPVSAEMQLEQLVAELFVTLTIECSPEDFKRYVAAVRTFLLEEAEATKMDQDNDTRRLSHEIGTNEFMHQIQQYFVPVRSKENTLSSIGKSILRLYERIAPLTA